MTQTTNTKLERLTSLRSALVDCMSQCSRDADNWSSDYDEWKVYAEMLGRVKDMLTDERRRQGYMAVYTIANGSAQDAIFEGTRDACKMYTDILLKAHPEMSGNIIVMQM